MKPIGGELPVETLSESIFFTDSGRSSFKLFIRSQNKDKRYLIPNFLCQVIEDILIQENVKYEFYNILGDMSIDSNSLLNKDFDVFYVINYFGKIHNLNDFNLEDKIVIEDNVFFYDFQNTNNFKNWFGFNSFRKITSLADGSLIKTNLVVDFKQIKHYESDFIENKYKAKNDKYDYIMKLKGTEKDYIELFENAENLLNLQDNIFSISKQSIYLMMIYDKYKEQSISKKYYDLLYEEFKSNCLNSEIQCYSFFVMKVSNRDELRKYLFSKNIFLPIHWPKISTNHQLCSEVISIPLFSYYTLDEIKCVINNIKEFYEKY